MGKKITRYTLYGWEYDTSYSPVEIELLAYRDGTPAQHPQSFHMANAWKLLFPEPHYVWNKWTMHRIKIWCGEYAPKGKEEYSTIIGPSSIGKSTDIGACALIDWWSSPRETRTVVCTNVAKTLEDKIWGEIVRLYDAGATVLRRHGHNPGNMNVRQMTLTQERDKNPKAVLKGVAIQRSRSQQDALAKISGAHATYNRIIVDEEQVSPVEIIEKACVNISASGAFKKMGLGNPFSPFDDMCSRIQPIGGWSKFTPEMAGEDGFLCIEGEMGMVYYFDGRKSPGVDDPVKFPFYLGTKRIEENAKRHGVDSAIYWQQMIGWPLGDAVGKTFVTEKDCSIGNVTAEAVWTDAPVVCASFDPGFSSDGDRGIMCIFKVGRDANGRNVIDFGKKMIHIDVKATSKQSVTDQIAHRVKLELHNHNVDPKNFVMDASSVTFVFADSIEKELGVSGVIMRIKSQEGASELPVSDEDDRVAKEVYANRVSELWGTMGRFIKAGQVRGLHMEIIQELCLRRIDENPNQQKIKAEPKTKMKKRIRRSPDAGDACVYALALVRERLGIYPGKHDDSQAQGQIQEGLGGLMDYDDDVAYKDNPFLV